MWKFVSFSRHTTKADYAPDCWLQCINICHQEPLNPTESTRLLNIITNLAVFLYFKFPHFVHEKWLIHVSYFTVYPNEYVI